MLAAAAVAAGCSTKRAVLTEAQLEERRVADNAEVQTSFVAAVERLVERIDREHNATGHTTIDFLALSGGGDYGAFGAGFLVGWGKAADSAHRRPDFDAVTGVSTGALIAPFAYVGTDESCEFVENWYRNPKSDWVQSRGLLPFLPYLVSFMEVPGLERDIRGVLTPEFIAQIAEQSKKGKLLAISATNLDLGTQRFWFVGNEAVKAQETGDPERVRRILMASAAIPAVFPPVEIDGFVYADGGVTANVFLRLDPKNPAGFLPTWKRKFPDRPLPKMRYWIIVNNQLQQPPKSVQLKWPAIIGPSLATAIRSATVSEIRWLAAQAEAVNATWGTDIEVRVVAIPNEWRAPVTGDFKKETMESLTDLGRKMGADEASWQVWVKPEKK